MSDRLEEMLKEEAAKRRAEREAEEARRNEVRDAIATLFDACLPGFEMERYHVLSLDELKYLRSRHNVDRPSHPYGYGAIDDLLTTALYQQAELARLREELAVADGDAERVRSVAASVRAEDAAEIAQLREQCTIHEQSIATWGKGMGRVCEALGVRQDGHAIAIAARCVADIVKAAEANAELRDDAHRALEALQSGDDVEARAILIEALGGGGS